MSRDQATPDRCSRRATRALVSLLALLVSGCARVPPVPVDQFYRLPAVAEGAARVAAPKPVSAGWLGEVIVVPVFRADGIHQERALLYSEDPAGLALQRYHYHYWADSPTRLLQEALAERLRRAGAGTLVLTGPDALPDVTVAGRIVEFEQRLGRAGPPRVRVGLEIEVRYRGERNPRWIRSYRAEEAADDGSLLAVVAAFGRGFERVTGAFIADIRRRATR